MAPRSRTLLIRADASADIGAGHLMRCLALAQAWQEAQGSAVFALRHCPGALADRLGWEGMGTERISATPGSEEDSVETIALAKRLDADWVVVDGYAFEGRYQDALRAAGLRVLVVDDYASSGHYSADLILNQNADADQLPYAERAPGIPLLLGPEFALLRREFWPFRGLSRATVPSGAARVLVTMGGGDPENVTLGVVDALVRLGPPDLEITVLIGGANPHLAGLDASCAGTNRVRLLSNVDNMAPILRAADVAITAAGSTCWELCLLGVPMCVVVLADNQRGNAIGLASRKIAVDLGQPDADLPGRLLPALTSLLADRDTRQGMASRGERLVDGLGAERVVRTLCRSAQPILSSATHS